MRRNLLPVMALLLGTLFLFLGNGLHGLLLPVRGAAEGYSNEVLGLLGTTWAAGFVLGCFVAPKWSCGSAMSAPSHLRLSDLRQRPAHRHHRTMPPGGSPCASSGFCTAGTSMIIESWAERAGDEREPRHESSHSTSPSTLIGVVGGQMLVGVFDPATTILFMICGIVLRICRAADADVDGRLTAAASLDQARSAPALSQLTRLLRRHSADRHRDTAPTAHLLPSSAPAPASMPPR